MNKHKKRDYDIKYKKLNKDKVENNLKKYRKAVKEFNNTLYQDRDYMHNTEKVCRKCEKTKKLTGFCRCIYIKGGFNTVCKECIKNEYKEKNKNKPKKVREKKVVNKKHNSPEEKRLIANERNRASYHKNKEKNKLRKAEFYKKNKDIIISRSVKYKKSRMSDPLYKLTANIRSRLYNAIVRKGFAKNGKTEEILGCSFEKFKEYIESLFEPWMNWSNYGLYNSKPKFGWDLDHIIPVSSAKSQEEVIKLNHYTNLQPLCSYQNRDVKKNKY